MNPWDISCIRIQSMKNVKFYDKFKTKINFPLGKSNFCEVFIAVFVKINHDLERK